MQDTVIDKQRRIAFLVRLLLFAGYLVALYWAQTQQCVRYVPEMRKEAIPFAKGEPSFYYRPFTRCVPSRDAKFDLSTQNGELAAIALCVVCWYVYLYRVELFLLSIWNRNFRSKMSIALRSLLIVLGLVFFILSVFFVMKSGVVLRET